MSTLDTKYYISDQCFLLENTQIFQKEPIYIGCQQMVPHVGNFYVSARDSNRFVLIHNHTGIKAISNICRHHQAILLKDSGHISQINCPFHHWKYDLEGQLINAPHFPQKPCDGLINIKLFSWENLLFKNLAPQITLSSNSLFKQIDFSDYQFSNSVELVSNYNWKIFIDNYLDDLHIPVIHPGLRCLVDMQTLQWECTNTYNIQQLQLKNKIPESKSEAFNHWANTIRMIQSSGVGITLNPVSWTLIYPNTMIEVYPYMITISTVSAVSQHRTLNHVDFLYPKLILEQFPQYSAISQACYLQTAKEDDKLCESIHAGKTILYANQENDRGYSHEFLEKGIFHFHQYYKNIIPD